MIYMHAKNAPVPSHIPFRAFLVLFTHDSGISMVTGVPGRFRCVGGVGWGLGVVIGVGGGKGGRGDWGGNRVGFGAGIG